MASSYHRFSREERFFIRRWYARAATVCIAHILGIDTAKVVDFVRRHSGERWARKSAQTLSRLRARAGRRGNEAQGKRTG